MSEGLSRAEAVGRAIRSELVAAGLSEKDLAAQVKEVIGPRTLQKVLNGQRGASVEELDAIAAPLLLKDAIDILHRAGQIAGRVASGGGTSYVQMGDNSGANLIIAGAATVDGDIHVEQGDDAEGAGS